MLQKDNQQFMRRTTQQTFLDINLASQQKTTKLYVSSHSKDPSIKSYFLMVSSPILLRSLRVYILKQSFFSISVNGGFRNIYLAAIHLDFKE